MVDRDQPQSEQEEQLELDEPRPEDFEPRVLAEPPGIRDGESAEAGGPELLALHPEDDSGPTTSGNTAED